MQALFQQGEFNLHSGAKSGWKIECDALTDADLEALAARVAQRMDFGDVVGVPRGGLRFANALKCYVTSGPMLIVDDVLTTGRSMQEMRQAHPDANGLVIFSRGICPPWVRPIFQTYF